MVDFERRENFSFNHLKPQTTLESFTTTMSNLSVGLWACAVSTLFLYAWNVIAFTEMIPSKYIFYLTETKLFFGNLKFKVAEKTAEAERELLKATLLKVNVAVLFM